MNRRTRQRARLPVLAELRARVRPSWAGPALAAAATAYIWAVDPNGSAGYLPCPTYTLTGTYCPGCGGLRSVHALLHGDLATSLDRNPAVLPLLLLLAVVGLRWLRRGWPPVRVEPSGWRFRLALALLGLFWLLRNVPGWSWLSPS